jgi:hypothetical protein
MLRFSISLQKWLEIMKIHTFVYINSHSLDLWIFFCDFSSPTNMQNLVQMAIEV